MGCEVLELPRSADYWSECARQLICGLCAKPSETFAENVTAHFGLVRLSEKLIPVVVPDVPLPAGVAQPQAALVSLVSHYAHYTEQEMGKRGSVLPKWLLKILFRAFRMYMGLLQTDHVVLVDNWLLTSNPSTRFSTEDLERLTALLSRAFPDRALSFRRIVPSLDPQAAWVFRASGLVHLRYRQVWVSPDSRRALSRFKDQRKDKRLLETSGYQVLGDNALLAEHAERLCQLYRQVYLDKHSGLNAAYSAEFITLLTHCGFMEFRALAKDGKIDTLKSWFVRDGTLFGCLVGYDTTQPRRAGLYRQAIMSQTLEASRLGYPVWMSGGVASFKSIRGGEPHDEFEAMYVAHLPLWRRWGWRALGRLTRKGANAPLRSAPSASGVQPHLE